VDGEGQIRGAKRPTLDSASDRNAGIGAEAPAMLGTHWGPRRLDLAPGSARDPQRVRHDGNYVHRRQLRASSATACIVAPVAANDPPIMLPLRSAIPPACCRKNSFFSRSCSHRNSRRQAITGSSSLTGWPELGTAGALGETRMSTAVTLLRLGACQTPPRWTKDNQSWSASRPRATNAHLPDQVAVRDWLE